MNVLLSACLDGGRPDGGGFRSRDDGDDKTLGDWRKKDDRGGGSDKFSDRDKKGKNVLVFRQRQEKTNVLFQLIFVAVVDLKIKIVRLVRYLD